MLQVPITLKFCLIVLISLVSALHGVKSIVSLPPAYCRYSIWLRDSVNLCNGVLPYDRVLSVSVVETESTLLLHRPERRCTPS